DPPRTPRAARSQDDCVVAWRAIRRHRSGADERGAGPRARASDPRPGADACLGDAARSAGRRSAGPAARDRRDHRERCVATPRVGSAVRRVLIERGKRLIAGGFRAYIFLARAGVKIAGTAPTRRLSEMREAHMTRSLSRRRFLALGSLGIPASAGFAG